MKRTICIVSIIVLIAVMMVTPAAAATTRYVCAVGCEYTNIQTALDASSDGDTVFVYNGTYTASYGDNNINKPNVTLKGEGADVVTLHGTEACNVIEIGGGPSDAPGCIVEGFTIECEAAGCVAVAVFSTAPNCIIRNNVLDGLPYDMGSIDFTADNTTFANNVVVNGTGAYGAICVHDCQFSKVVNNTIRDNAGAGVLLYSDIGIAANNTITGNNISSNGYGIFAYSAGSGNKIYLNNFIDNGVTATTSGTTAPAVTYWNSTEQIEYTYGEETGECYMGNYWKGHSDGESAECPGIWDTSYVVPDSLGNDYRPLMAGYENYPEAAGPTPTPTPTPTPNPPVGVPEFNAIGLIALIGVLSVVLAVTTVGSKRRRE